MEPPSSIEHDTLQEGTDFDDRLEFARQIGNHQADFFQLNQALSRTARRYFESAGFSGAELEALAPLPAPPPDWYGMPTTGSVKVFALLIEFPDEVHHNSMTDINDALFGSPATPKPYESLAAFYRRSSYGLLEFSGATLGWYKASRNRSSVPRTTAGREALIKEAIQHFNAKGHDFRQYDNDRDGVVDYFMVFWTGSDTGWASFWWGYQTVFQDSAFTVDGVKLGRYSWQWEARPVGSKFTPVVCIHETGHALGLPDLYDYEAGVGPEGGVGGADMMDANAFDHNCFSKWMLEWCIPTVITSGCQTINLAPAGESPDCVAIWPALKEHKMFSELFMVQNRQPVQNDLHLPDSGLLIWHIDASLDGTGRNFAFDNSYTAHKYIRLMEADGREDIEAVGRFDVRDFFTPGDTFGPRTVPSSAAYDGTDTGIAVSRIISSESNITADMCALRPGPCIDVPTTVNFGVVQLGGQRKAKVTVSNVGSETLNCKIYFPLSGDFKPYNYLYSGMCGSDSSLPPGSSCSIGVVFIPTEPLTFSFSKIEIASNDPDRPVVEVLLQGENRTIAPQ